MKNDLINNYIILYKMGNTSSGHDFNNIMQTKNNNMSFEEEEQLLVHSYTNELKLNRYTKDQVKDKLYKFMIIYENPNRKFNIIKDYIATLN